MTAWMTEADGVFRGGGVKGLALAGALIGFARHPTKPVTSWVNVAGASAGAIIASYLACGHGADELVELLRKTNFAQFEDFPPGGKVLGGGVNLVTRHGLAHGKVFLDWFDEVLEHKTFADVKTPDGQRSRLKLIAADVTNRQLLVLPDDLPVYREPGADAPIDPDRFPIARAARMSMSIPYFFEPITLVRVDNGRESTIVDGGTLSNFPVWLFDTEKEPPTRPTFGFTLHGGRGVGAGLQQAEHRLPWLARLAFDIFHTSQEAWDARFVSHSTRVRTVAVEAGTIGTTQFDLTREQQQALVDSGIAAATTFLDEFDLDEYMNTFHQTLEAPAPAVV